MDLEESRDTDPTNSTGRSPRSGLMDLRLSSTQASSTTSTERAWTQTLVGSVQYIGLCTNLRSASSDGSVGNPNPTVFRP